MRKLFTLCFVLAVLFSLVSCDSKDPNATESISLEDAFVYFEEMYNGDAKNMQKAVPNVVWNNLKNNVEDYDAFKRGLESQIKDSFKDLQADYGEDVHVTITYQEDPYHETDEEDIRMSGKMMGYYGIESDLVKDVQHLQVTATIEGSKDKTEKALPLIAIQIDNSWYLIHKYSSQFLLDIPVYSYE